jgi:hypothetical protein
MWEKGQLDICSVTDRFTEEIVPDSELVQDLNRDQPRDGSFGGRKEITRAPLGNMPMDAPT